MSRTLSALDAAAPPADGQRHSPRSGSVKDAINHYGLSRSSLYELAARHPGFFKKYGTKTMVDYAVGDAIVDNLPPAKINLPYLAKPKRHIRAREEA
jgi:hypothetical protein